MIADQSKVVSLGDAERYLRVGHKGQEVDERARVDWSTTRNLPTEDTQLAKTYMEATAELRDHRVEAPFYSVSVSFPEDDAPKVDRALMEKAADRVIEGLGLQEHEAIIVAHKDRGHPHFHILANRIHPEMGKAWATWNDYKKTDQVLRAFEIEHGLTRVSTWSVEPELQEELPSLPRKSQVDFVEHLRGTEVPAALKVAQSWPELEDRLAAHGLVLQRSGRGLQLTDGEKVAKISALHRKSSLKNLETRFGETWEEWADRSPETAVEPPDKRGRSGPAPEISERAKRAATIAEPYERNGELARLSGSVEATFRDAHSMRERLKADRSTVERRIQSALDQVTTNRPTLHQVTGTSPAGTEQRQTPGGKTDPKRTPEDPKQTPLELFRKEVTRLTEQKKAAPKAIESTPLEIFRQRVAETIDENDLRGRNRFFRGDDPERIRAKAAVRELPELLQRREQLARRYAETDRRVAQGGDLSLRLKNAKAPTPSDVDLYQATRGIPTKCLERVLPSNALRDVRAVRRRAAGIWIAIGPHLGRKGADLLLAVPDESKQGSRRGRQKPMGARARGLALRTLPKAIRPVVKLALGKKKAQALTLAVLGRLMPPQLQTAIEVLKMAVKVARVAAKVVEKTLDHDRGR